MEFTKTTRGNIGQREGTDDYYIQDDAASPISIHDWGQKFSRTAHDDEFTLVQFKNTRKEFFLNSNLLSLHRGDIVAVAANPGHDIGIVVLTGWLARRQYLRTHDPETPPPPPLYRKATTNDIDKWLEVINKEYDSMLTARRIALDLGLKMKISDVEYQGDGTKASFFYSAEKRVDFRELVRILANEFRVRIEMRQIGPRQEAGRIGGIGTCGNKLCCNSWMQQFSSVTTSVIKTQELTPNPQKQAGQCGKLKCCLNFEVDAYEQAKKRFPRIRKPLLLDDCQLYHVKNDLFREYMWFSQVPKSTANLTMLTLAQVQNILALNAKGEKAPALSGLSINTISEPADQNSYDNVIEEESITRFDKRKRRNKGKSRNRRNNPKNKNSKP